MLQERSKIDDRIEVLEQQLLSVKGRETEKYARIVGYYRAVKNWNKGKKEEYKFRVNFSETKFDNAKNGSIKNIDTENTKSQALKSTDKISTYKFFYRTTCPNCPPVKAIISNLEIKGERINADTSKGFTEAAKLEIFSAPTVVFFNDNGKEVYRTSAPADLKNLIEDKKII